MKQRKTLIIDSENNVCIDTSCAIKVESGLVYYFNENNIYSTVKKSDANKAGLSYLTVDMTYQELKNESKLYNEFYYDSYKSDLFNFYNNPARAFIYYKIEDKKFGYIVNSDNLIVQQLFNKSVSKLQLGDHINDFFRYFNEFYNEFRKKQREREKEQQRAQQLVMENLLKEKAEREKRKEEEEKRKRKERRLSDIEAEKHEKLFKLNDDYSILLDNRFPINTVETSNTTYAYYFDDNWVLQKGVYKELDDTVFKDADPKKIHSNYKELHRQNKCEYGFWGFGIAHSIKAANGNTTAFALASKSMELGKTYHDFVEFFKQAMTDKNFKVDTIDRKIGSISKPMFRRAIDNKKTNTFDFVSVDVNLVCYLDNDLKETVQKYYKPVSEKVLEKIEASAQFKKYGVPINFLKLSNVTVLKSGIVQFLFELKEIERVDN